MRYICNWLNNSYTGVTVFRQWHVSNALIFERYLDFFILVRHLLTGKTPMTF